MCISIPGEHPVLAFIVCLTMILMGAYMIANGIRQHKEELESDNETLVPMTVSVTSVDDTEVFVDFMYEGKHYHHIHYNGFNPKLKYGMMIKGFVDFSTDNPQFVTMSRQKSFTVNLVLSILFILAGFGAMFVLIMEG